MENEQKFLILEGLISGTYKAEDLKERKHDKKKEGLFKVDLSKDELLFYLRELKENSDNYILMIEEEAGIDL
jgi:hypothetical protein